MVSCLCVYFKELVKIYGKVDATLVRVGAVTVTRFIVDLANTLEKSNFGRELEDLVGDRTDGALALAAEMIYDGLDAESDVLLLLAQLRSGRRPCHVAALKAAMTVIAERMVAK